MLLGAIFGSHQKVIFLLTSYAWNVEPMIEIYTLILKLVHGSKQFFFFFEIKGRSTAMSFKNIASLHHAPKRNTTTATTQTTHANNTRNKMLHHHKLGEKPKEATVSCAVVANAVPHQCGPLQTIAATRNSSTMGKSPSSHTHDRRSPSLSRS